MWPQWLWASHETALGPVGWSEVEVQEARRSWGLRPRRGVGQATEAARCPPAPWRVPVCRSTRALSPLPGQVWPWVPGGTVPPQTRSSRQLLLGTRAARDPGLRETDDGCLVAMCLPL